MKITIMVLAVLTALTLTVFALSQTAEAQPAAQPVGAVEESKKADAPAATAEPSTLAEALASLKAMRAEWKAFKDRKKPKEEGGSGEGTSGALIGLLLAGFAVLSTWGKTARRWLNRDK